jgi:hypothetical protein
MRGVKFGRRSNLNFEIGGQKVNGVVFNIDEHVGQNGEGMAPLYDASNKLKWP